MRVIEERTAIDIYLQGKKVDGAILTEADNLHFVDNDFDLIVNPGANQTQYLPVWINYDSIEATAGLPLRQTSGSIGVGDAASWRSTLVRDIGPLPMRLFDFVRVEGQDNWATNDLLSLAYMASLTWRDNGLLQFSIIEDIDLIGQRQAQRWTPEYYRSIDGVPAGDKTLDRVTEIAVIGIRSRFPGFSPADTHRQREEGS